MLVTTYILMYIGPGLLFSRCTNQLNYALYAIITVRIYTINYMQTHVAWETLQEPVGEPCIQFVCDDIPLDLS